MAIIIIGLSLWSYLRGKEKGYEEGFNEGLEDSNFIEASFNEINDIDYFIIDGKKYVLEEDENNEKEGNH